MSFQTHNVVYSVENENAKEGILKNVSTVFVQTMKVNIVQNESKR